MYIKDVELDLPMYVKIRNELILQGRTYRWLAINLGLTYNHTYKMLNGIVAITENSRQEINELLKTSY